MNCRHCATELSQPFLDLGASPPSNAYLTERTLHQSEAWFPLRVMVCTACRLVQTEDTARADTLFDADYAYFSSFSSTWLQHAQQYVADMSVRLELGVHSKVVEVAANDGYLLQYVQQRGIPCIGIEPTANTAKAARAKGLTIVEHFFGVALARDLVADGHAADLSIANNVLAHVPDINDFVAGFAILLKPQGVATFEFPHLLRMVQQSQFDTAYHEHYSYLSLSAVERIFYANGLKVFDVDPLPTHGGSLRVHAQRADTGQRRRTPMVDAVLAEETTAGMLDDGFYTTLQAQAERIKDDLLIFLIEARRSGLKVAAYGAAAKGNTLLNFAGIRTDLLPYVVDRNPNKQGKFMPGSRIPIVAENRLMDDRPDRILILPWNLREEVVAQLAYVAEWGGLFVTAVPTLTLMRAALPVPVP